MSDATESVLAELEQLAREATPGPWYTVGPPWLPSGMATYIVAGHMDPHIGRPVCDFNMPDDGDTPDNTWNDAEYVAACHPTAILALIARLRAAEAERDRLQAFKTWVHAYLDTQGVPHHPPGTHGDEGCRIGDRMDWLMGWLKAVVVQRDAAEAERDEARAKALSQAKADLDAIRDRLARHKALHQRCADEGPGWAGDALLESIQDRSTLLARVEQTTCCETCEQWDDMATEPPPWVVCCRCWNAAMLRKKEEMDALRREMDGLREAAVEECAAKIDEQRRLLSTMFEDKRHVALCRDLAAAIRRLAAGGV